MSPVNFLGAVIFWSLVGHCIFTLIHLPAIPSFTCEALLEGGKVVFNVLCHAGSRLLFYPKEICDSLKILVTVIPG